MDDHSVTLYISQLKHDENASTAQHEIWKRYFHRLVALAQTRLKTVAAADGEDIALSALNSFFQRAPRGKFPKLSDRDSLWPLLAQIATRKAINEFKKDTALKRGGGKVLAEVDLSSDEGQGRLDSQIAGELTPEFADETFAHMRHLLDFIEDKDPDLHKIAVMKLQGYSTSEIARERGCVRRTIERKTNRIRSILEKENIA